MNLGNFTIKAAEAFQQAQQLAFNAQNPNIETEHILKALLDQEESTVEYLLKKNNVTLNLVDSRLDELIEIMYHCTWVQKKRQNSIAKRGSSMKDIILIGRREAIIEIPAEKFLPGMRLNPSVVMQIVSCCVRVHH